MPDLIRIAIVDDHPIFLSGLKRIIHDSDGCKVIAEGTSADAAVDIALRERPDVMLLDITMPGDGIEAARRIQQTVPAVRLIMLTASMSDEHVTRAFAAGAMGYLVKGAEAKDVRLAIRNVHRGERHIDPALAGRLLRDIASGKSTVSEPSEPTPRLNRREEEILQGVAEGLPNKEIAKRLNVALPTIKNTMTRIMKKLNARNRVQAVARIRNIPPAREV